MNKEYIRCGGLAVSKALFAIDRAIDENNKESDVAEDILNALYREGIEIGYIKNEQL